MREIKFRAYFKNKVYDVVELDLKDKNVVLVSIEKDKSAQKISFYKSLDEVELVRYTGLRDIINVPIYEGDILRTLEDENNRNFKVVFKDGCFVPDIDNEPLLDWNINSYVLGNIYLDPEFLD